METRSASSLSASGICSGLFTGAISTLMPFCNMGVTTMKMISSTSITSTMGVTLMSDVTFAPSFRLASAIASPALLPRSGIEKSAPALAGKVRRRYAAPDKQLTTETRPKLLPANVAALLEEVIDQFAGRVVHLDVERFH